MRQPVSEIEEPSGKTGRFLFCRNLNYGVDRLPRVAVSALERIADSSAFTPRDPFAVEPKNET
jgi:hypothetical protein